MELEIINKLYLELSQFATAKTENEIELEKILINVLRAWSEDGVTEENKKFFNIMAFKFRIFKVDRH